MMLVLKNILFAILLPGTVTVLVPWLIVSGGNAAQWNAWRLLGLLPIVLGFGTVARCIWDFAVTGQGTLAPIDPPKALVVQGLYRYVRNPMYIGVLLVLLGEAWYFRSRALLVYAGLSFLVVNVFVLLYEEPHLRRRFGESYTNYCRTVNRWVPRRRGKTRRRGDAETRRASP